MLVSGGWEKSLQKYYPTGNLMSYTHDRNGIRSPLGQQWHRYYEGKQPFPGRIKIYVEMYDLCVIFRNRMLVSVLIMQIGFQLCFIVSLHNFLLIFKISMSNRRLFSLTFEISIQLHHCPISLYPSKHNTHPSLAIFKFISSFFFHNVCYRQIIEAHY